MSKEELDDRSILIRVYGNSTEILVDRESMSQDDTETLRISTNAIQESSHVTFYCNNMASHLQSSDDLKMDMPTALSLVLCAPLPTSPAGPYGEVLLDAWDNGMLFYL